MLVDSHYHLDRVSLKPYDSDFDRLMTETVGAGVGHLLCVSIDLDAYPRMRALVEPYRQVSVSVGVHPNEQDRREPTHRELGDGRAGHGPGPLRLLFRDRDLQEMRTSYGTLSAGCRWIGC